MFPYYLLIIIPFVFSFVRKNESKVIIGYKSHSINNNYAIESFFITFLLLLTLRANTIGRDLSNYLYMFNYYRRISWAELVEEFSALDGQLLFRVLSKIIATFTDDFNIYKGIIAFLGVVPIMRTYSEEKDNSLLKIALYLNMSTFIIMFSALRQSLALAVGTYFCYKYTKERKPFQFLIACIIAFLFHHSGFMLLFMYPVYHMRLRKSSAYFIIPIIAFVFIFNRQIYSLLSRFLSDISSKYSAEIRPTDAYGSFLLFTVFSVMSFLLVKEDSLTQNEYGLRNLLLLAVCIQIFAALNPLAMRLNYYYIIFIPIVVPQILKNEYAKNVNTSAIIRLVLGVFFLFLFVRSVYISSKTGVSALDTYPYRALWDSQ